MLARHQAALNLAQQRGDEADRLELLRCVVWPGAELEELTASRSPVRSGLLGFVRSNDLLLGQMFGRSDG